VANNSSRSAIREVSTRMRLVSIGISRIVASSMSPVSPMPPTVAQNSAGWCRGPITAVDPSASTMVIDSMCLPIDPST
jgi:hypothetical protein